MRNFEVCDYLENKNLQRAIDKDIFIYLLRENINMMKCIKICLLKSYNNIYFTILHFHLIVHIKLNRKECDYFY